MAWFAIGDTRTDAPERVVRTAFQEAIKKVTMTYKIE